MNMSRETIWLIVAGFAALLAVPLIYMGLQNETDALVMAGFCLFTLGMMISPVLRLTKNRKEKRSAKKEEGPTMRRA
jgi:uncharacterized membrane protein YiaA